MGLAGACGYGGNGGDDGRVPAGGTGGTGTTGKELHSASKLDETGTTQFIFCCVTTRCC